MQIVADFHLHSKYSRATSQRMSLEGISKGAKVKGLNLLGTADFTFKKWLDELKTKLEPIEGSGLFKFNDIYYILTGEIATYFFIEGQSKKVHHVIHVPSFEIAEQISERLGKFGNLYSDGRPMLKVSAPELVEVIREVSSDALIYPAHAWTPWMSCLGSKSGFDSVEECYQDQTKSIFALETGMSSDPAMNWRLSSLDKFTLVSNSDSHSPWSWRLGREANVFDVGKMDYWEIFDIIRNKDNKKFLHTIETSPFYGKYHYTGHRSCGINLPPKEAMKFNNICPVCKKELTVGVLQRVEELADRPEGFVPKDAIPFKTLLPLYEIISFAFGTGELYSKKVLVEHDKLIERFGNELNVLLNAPKEELVKVTNDKIAESIIKAREGKVDYIAGYDGVYGQPIFNEEDREKINNLKMKIATQKNLVDFKK